MLPLPGSPATSWSMFRARFQATFRGVDFKIVSAFWLFGLINNVLYVIILSAALDLVGPNVPKAVVLLADVIPSFLAKLCVPYFIHLVSYPVRVVIFALTSTWGMLLIALTPAYTDGGTITTKMAGVILASLSCGAGELSFLALTHFYGSSSLAAWSSGTGGAGLIGAGAYAVATTTIGLSIRTSLLASAFLPAIMVISFFMVLPRGPLIHSTSRHSGVSQGSVHDQWGNDSSSEESGGTRSREDEALLSDSGDSIVSSKSTRSAAMESFSWRANFVQNLRRSRGLVFPYMLPLFIVYLAEYMINQSVTPTLLFPLASTPFTHYRSFYPTYALIYQFGVFVSRSSLPLVRLHHLYPPSFLQCLNLVLLILQCLFDYIPSVYIVFFAIFWEGLLGGAVYVNTFALIADEVNAKDREFALAATGLGDSTGIMVAGLLGIGLEEALCGWQVARGRDWCRKL